MSMLRCERCPGLIDTDEQPEIYDGESDTWICAICRDAEMESHRAEYNAAPLSERNPAQYRHDMIDAGHGHLLGDE